MSIPQSEMRSSPAERALTLGIQLFRFSGGLLLFFFVVEALFSLMELRLRNPASELRFSTQMTDRIPLALLGLTLLLCHPRFFRQKIEVVIMRIIATLPLVLAGIYILLIPLITFAAANYFRNTTYGLDQ